MSTVAPSMRVVEYFTALVQGIPGVDQPATFDDHAPIERTSAKAITIEVAGIDPEADLDSADATGEVVELDFVCNSKSLDTAMGDALNLSHQVRALIEKDSAVHYLQSTSNTERVRAEYVGLEPEDDNDDPNESNTAAVRLSYSMLYRLSRADVFKFQD